MTHTLIGRPRRSAISAILAISALLTLAPSSAMGQGAADSTFVKRGFSFGVLPAISYDSDLGFQYGVLSNMYWYGDGSRYPAYDHSLYVECSRYPAGTMLCRAYYDSPLALSRWGDKLRLTADITWYRDLLSDFFGFNGRQTIYHDNWADEDADGYVSHAFYAYHRQMTRLMVGVRIGIGETPLYVQAGVSAFNIKCGSVHRDELRGTTPDVPGLYDLYRQWGVIRADEAEGGTDVFLRAGFGIDTRDFEAFPTKGVWSEALLALEPSIFTSCNYGFVRLTLNHRQYFSLGSPDLVLAYRLTFQNRLFGRVPFYLLPHITTNTLTSATSQGLGGAKTMRGVMRNRIVADGVAMANVELRWLIKRFQLLGQQWAIGTNIFADLGTTTQNYKVNLDGVPADLRDAYFRSGNDKLHSSAGLGLKIHMNSNFIVSADFGKAMSSDDGNTGIYVMLNYLF